MKLFMQNLTVISEYLPNHDILNFSDAVLDNVSLDDSDKKLFDIYESKNLVLEELLDNIKYFMYIVQGSFNEIVELDKSKEFTDEEFIQKFGEYFAHVSNCFKADVGLIIVNEKPLENENLSIKKQEQAKIVPLKRSKTRNKLGK